jgi:cobalt-zinc-cadmium efflux system protein
LEKAIAESMQTNGTHDHSHQALNYNSAFKFGITINITYIIIELIYGLVGNSMALIADAGHNLSDVLGLGLTWGAAYLATTSVTSKRTYGLRKSTVLASLLNAIILLIAVGAISIESIRRIIHPEPSTGMTMVLVAAIGIIVNGITAFLFMKGRQKDLNIKAAFVHMSSDALVSFGVVIAGLIIRFTGWELADPIVSLVIVIVIGAGTWRLLKDSFHLSMDAVPKGINLEEVKKYLNSLEGVSEVHDLHIWAMSTTENALTAHLVVPNERKEDDFLKKICSNLHNNFGIEHATIQIEKSAQAANCSLESV